MEDLHTAEEGTSQISQDPWRLPQEVAGHDYELAVEVRATNHRSVPFTITYQRIIVSALERIVGTDLLGAFSEGAAWPCRDRSFLLGLSFEGLDLRRR